MEIKVKNIDIYTFRELYSIRKKNKEILRGRV